MELLPELRVEKRRGRMTAEEIIKSINDWEVEIPKGSSLLAILVDEQGKADMAGTASPQVLKAVGLHLIELAVRGEIKAAL